MKAWWLAKDHRTAQKLWLRKGTLEYECPASCAYWSDHLSKYTHLMKWDLDVPVPRQKDCTGNELVLKKKKMALSKRNAFTAGKDCILVKFVLLCSTYTTEIQQYLYKNTSQIKSSFTFNVCFFKKIQLIVKNQLEIIPIRSRNEPTETLPLETRLYYWRIKRI